MKQKLYPVRGNLAAKIGAVILLPILLAMTVLSCAGISVILDDGYVYTMDKEAFQQNNREMFARDIVSTFHWVVTENSAHHTREYVDHRVNEHLQDTNVARIEMTVWGENPVSWRWNGKAEQNDYCEVALWWLEEDQMWIEQDPEFQGEFYHQIKGDAKVRLPLVPVVHDSYWGNYMITEVLYVLRYWIYLIAALSLAGLAGLLVFLVKAAGLRTGKQEVRIGWTQKIPADLMAAVLGIGEVIALELLLESSYVMTAFRKTVAVIVMGTISYVLAIYILMHFSARFKIKGWWKHTVIYTLWKYVNRGGKVLWNLLSKLPSMPKTALSWGALLLLDGLITLFISVGMRRHPEYAVICWIIKAIVLTGLLAAVILMVQKLREGAQKLADGELSYQVDTAKMPPLLKEHGENLNHIAEGMSLAVEKQLKSERMKTELITNVSHDIKTPLTSIINYSDLIEKEPTDNGKITEYAQVLHRQSERLKRLVEDLVEASKASTGNLEVVLVPCEADVMLTQVAGEYEEKLENSNLELHTSIPQDSVKIMADGRRLWRVFDNLLGNICKYAMPGTRVYLTLEEIDHTAVISFKNISRDSLNVSAQELLERFVRGDQARNSEGNGLGLSIAKSLTELQKGTLELSVDGDLFKVILRFPTI